MVDSTLVFKELEHDFLQYMLHKGGIAKKTSHDYISRMRFLSNSYVLDSNVTEEYIEYIMNEERKVYTNRNRYNTPKALGDLHAGLRKFLSFIQSDYLKQQKETIISEIKKVEDNIQLSSTERTQIIQSRIGQGLFRNQLIEYWNGCSVSGCSLLPVLVASHIKPWYVSDNIQRLDPFNGLLLQPNIDKLFDRGYITFDTKGNIICSSFLDKSDRLILGIDNNMHLRKIDDMHKQYLEYHQNNCFMG